MKAKIIGGPYDGGELDPNDVNLYTKFVPVGHRKFIFMPPADKWDAVRRGEEDKDGDLGEREIYEIVRRSHGVEAIHDPIGQAFESAMRTESDGTAPQPVFAPFTGAYYRCIRGSWALVIPDHFQITDEKDRVWACSEVSREEAEGEDVSSGFAFALRARDEIGTDERLFVSTVHCESQLQLPAKLADLID